MTSQIRTGDTYGIGKTRAGQDMEGYTLGQIRVWHDRCQNNGFLYMHV